MAKTKTIAGMKVIPAGFRPVTLPDGSVALQRKGRRRRPRLSPQARRRIAAAARRFKVPVLTVGAQLPWAIPFISAIMREGGAALNGDENAQRSIANKIIAPFTGIVFNAGWKPQFVPRRMLQGLAPNLALMFIKRTGVFRGINQKLARMRIPVRLT